jgi:beta-glucosidase
MNPDSIPTTSPAVAKTGRNPYQDPSLPIPQRVDDLLARMTLDEKIGQMTLVEKNSIDPAAVRQLAIGGVLSGGGGYPADNSPAGWLAMVRGYQEAACQTRLGIPLIYGVDAVHGHSNLCGATIFPHNIGLGAAGDPELVRRIGRATAEETAATGIRWNYAPTIAVPQDVRWGRSYEGFAQDPAVVARLGAAYIRGLQGDDPTGPLSVLATAKHYLGDGGTTWGTSTMLFPPVPPAGIAGRTPFTIDQGDTRLDELALRAIHLAPYVEALAAGALTVMASFSSWNGVKLHTHRYLLTDVLKGELGFAGFVVSDWKGIGQLAVDGQVASNYEAVVACINAGIDMNMVPFADYPEFMADLRLAVDRGDVPLARIDDAVGRILAVKMAAGLFERPVAGSQHLARIGTAEHRALARQAAARSAVLLKNDGRPLPLPKSLPRLLVAGRWADDIGLQCGGWTIDWLGGSGPITAGTTILEAIRQAVSPQTAVTYDPDAAYAEGAQGVEPAEVGLVFLGERPYAEGFGDRADLTLEPEQTAVLERMRGRCRKLVLVLVTGRPLIITDLLPMLDGLVVAWLPGSEGQGVADVLFGDMPFSGRLTFEWPRDMGQVPLGTAGAGRALFPAGFGL